MFVFKLIQVFGHFGGCSLWAVELYCDILSSVSKMQSDLYITMKGRFVQGLLYQNALVLATAI